MEKDNNSNDYVSTGKAAKVLNVNSKTVRRWVDNGKIAGFKSNTNMRYVYLSALDNSAPTTIIADNKTE